MSKSRGNVVNPDAVIKEYGTDTLRAYILFIGPLDTDAPWSTEGINGVNRFIRRMWNQFVQLGRESNAIKRKRNRERNRDYNR